MFELRLVKQEQFWTFALFTMFTMRMTHDWMSTREKRQDIYDDKMGWEYYGVHVHCIAYILFSSDTEM